MDSNALNTKSPSSSRDDVLTNSSSTGPISEELIRSIAKQLSCIGTDGLSGIQCKLEGDVIVLLGTVRSFYSKQQVQEFVRSLKLPVSIDNRCVVEETDRPIGCDDA